MALSLIPSNSRGPSARGVRVPRTMLIALLMGLGMVALCAALAVAKEKQVSSIVTGAVLDDADNGLAGATVVLTDLNTGKRSAAYTQEGGRYQFSDLKPSHDYEVQASYGGATSEVRRVSSLDTRTRIVVNLRITLPKP